MELLKTVPSKRKSIKNIEELKAALNRFLIYYNTNRRHGELTKELRVRAPCEAVKSWFEIEPQNFKISPDAFYATLLNGMV